MSAAEKLNVGDALKAYRADTNAKLLSALRARAVKEFIDSPSDAAKKPKDAQSAWFSLLMNPSDPFFGPTLGRSRDIAVALISLARDPTEKPVFGVISALHSETQEGETGNKSKGYLVSRYFSIEDDELEKAFPLRTASLDEAPSPRNRFWLRDHVLAVIAGNGTTNEEMTAIRNHLNEPSIVSDPLNHEALVREAERVYSSKAQADAQH